MKKYIFLLSVLILGCNVFAQEADDIYDVVNQIDPIEPTAAGLGKYGTYPVNYSTGLPTISIPLYTIKSGGLTVPIELRYHGGGIKVNEDASWVGLGWDLFYGGTITRKVNGKKDETEISFTNVPNSAEIFEGMQDGSLQAGDLNNYANGSYQTDEYNYNINGVSGTFVYDNNDEPFEIPFVGNKIIFPIGIASKGRSITATDGTKYEFLEKDVTESGDQNSPTTYNSTWHLHKITSHGGADEISYTYQNDGVIGIKSYGQSAGTIETRRSSGHPNPYDKKEMLVTTSRSKQKVTSKKPHTIVFKNGRITFHLGERLDVFDGNDNVREDLSIKRLDFIVVEELGVDGAYKEVQRFEFDYDYFRACETVDNRDYSKTDPDCLKLKLFSVSKHVPNNPIPQVLAKFTYDESNTPPKKNSTSQDYWGYYNGATNGEYLIPRAYLPGSSFNANRMPNESKMKTNNLVSIEYPTSGKTIFNWEFNRYGADSPIVSEYQSESLGVSLSHSTLYYYKDSIRLKGEGGVDKDIDDFPAGIYEVSELFEIYVDQNVEVTYEAAQIDDHDENHRKYDQGSAGLYTWGGTIPIAGQSFYHNSAGVRKEIVKLSKGKYVLRARRNCSNIQAFVSVKYNAYNPDIDKNNYPIGGLRVKSIVNKDADNKQISKKEFTYINPATNKSSGVLNGTKKQTFVDVNRSYSTAYTEINGIPICHDVQVTTTTVHSSAVSGAYANSVNYEYVQVYDVDNDGNDNGFVEYKFEVGQDGFYGDKLPIISNSWRRGQQLKETHYKNTNGTYYKEKESISSYNIDNRSNQVAIGFKMFSFGMPENGPCPGAGNDFGISLLTAYEPVNYQYTTGIKQLESKTTIEYLADGEFTTEEKYFYNDYGLLSGKEQIIDNKLYLSTYKYTTDYAPEGCYLQRDNNVFENESRIIACNDNYETNQVNYNALLSTLNADFDACYTQNVTPWRDKYRDCANETDLNYGECKSTKWFCTTCVKFNCKCNFQQVRHHECCIDEYLEPVRIEEKKCVDAMEADVSAEWPNTPYEIFNTCLDNLIDTESEFNTCVQNKTYTAQSDIFLNMVEANILSPIIEKSQYIGDDYNTLKLYSSVFNFYEDINNTSEISNYKPTKIYSLESDNPIDINIPSDFEDFKLVGLEEDGSGIVDFVINDALKEKLHLKYNENTGNIQEQSKTDDMQSAYYWAYNNGYPIIKAENTTFVELEAAVNSAPKAGHPTLDEYLFDLNATGGFFDINGNFITTNKNSWEAFVNSIQTALPDAIISLYTYDPLIGMTSQTDPNGKTTYYEYDDFGRLKNIKDFEGNVLKQMDYHYSSQNN